MITDITIKGYQSHVNSTFHLSPGLTVITGPTDSGKTAIIRAVRWVAFNEPAGDGFVNESVGEAIVQIVKDDGTIINKGRKKGGRTSYHLALANGTSQIFEQADVPPEITAALGMTRQSFGDFETALNFAFQLEAPFLISEPPSAGAKVLGVIAGTEIVDLAIKATSKDTHAARAERLKADQDVQQNEKDLKQYEDLDALIEQGQACETLMRNFDELVARAAALRILELQDHVAEAKISDLDQRIAGLNLDVVTPLVEWLPAQYERYNRLNTLNENSISEGLVIRACAARLERLSGIPEMAEKLATVERSATRKDSLIDLLSRSVSVMQTLQTAKLTLDGTQHLDDVGDNLTKVVNDLDKRTNLAAIESKWLAAKSRLWMFEDTLESSKDLDVAAALVADLATSGNRLDELKQLRTRHQAVVQYLQVRDDIIESTAGIAQAAAMLASAVEKRDKLQRLRETVSIFRIKADTFKQTEARIPAAERAIAAQEQLLQGLWAELNVCPLCEQPI